MPIERRWRRTRWGVRLLGSNRRAGHESWRRLMTHCRNELCAAAIDRTMLICAGAMTAPVASDWSGGCPLLAQGFPGSVTRAGIRALRIGPQSS